MSSGGPDIFVAKLDKDGNRLWVKTSEDLQTTGDEESRSSEDSASAEGKDVDIVPSSPYDT